MVSPGTHRSLETSRVQSNLFFTPANFGALPELWLQAKLTVELHFFLVRARCLSAGLRSSVSLADQWGIEPPPAVCQRHKSAAVPTAPRGRLKLTVELQPFHDKMVWFLFLCGLFGCCFCLFCFCLFCFCLVLLT